MTVVGVRPVLEALSQPGRVDRIFIGRERGGATQRIEEAARLAGIPVKSVPREALDRMAGPGRRHQGVVAELRESRIEPLDLGTLLDRLGAAQSSLVLLLDGIQDPGNLGAVLRSAHALGVDGVILPQDRCAPLGPAALKSSAGAALHVPVARVVNLKHALEPLESAGFWTAAAVMDGEPVWEADLDRPLALVVGGEEKGVRPTLSRKCALRVSIPMAAGFDSLNVSVATGIILYEILRQRSARREQTS